MIDLAKLVVTMEAENAQLLRKLEQSDKRFKKFEKNTTGVFQKIGGAYKSLIGVVGAGVLVAKLNQTAAELDKIGKTASRVGLTTDALQELRFAANQGGVQTNTLDLAMQRFSRRVGEVAQGVRRQSIWDHGACFLRDSFLLVAAPV